MRAKMRRRPVEREDAKVQPMGRRWAGHPWGEGQLEPNTNGSLSRTDAYL